jgi:hypothetical protein
VATARISVPAAVAAEAAVVAQSVIGGFCHSRPDQPAEAKSSTITHS